MAQEQFKVQNITLPYFEGYKFHSIGYPMNNQYFVDDLSHPFELKQYPLDEPKGLMCCVYEKIKTDISPISGFLLKSENINFTKAPDVIIAPRLLEGPPIFFYKYNTFINVEDTTYKRELYPSATYKLSELLRNYTEVLGINLL